MNNKKVFIRQEEIIIIIIPTPKAKVAKIQDRFYLRCMHLGYHKYKLK